VNNIEHRMKAGDVLVSKKGLKGKVIHANDFSMVVTKQ